MEFYCDSYFVKNLEKEGENKKYSKKETRTAARTQADLIVGGGNVHYFRLGSGRFAPEAGVAVPEIVATALKEKMNPLSFWSTQWSRFDAP